MKVGLVVLARQHIRTGDWSAVPCPVLFLYLPTYLGTPHTCRMAKHPPPSPPPLHRRHRMNLRVVRTLVV